MKDLHRILKYVKIDVWKINLIVNLRGIRMIWLHFWLFGNVLESHFGCEFTRDLHDLGAFLGAWKSIGEPF